MEQHIDISMKITRNDHKLSSVSVIMPTWNRKSEDGKIYASIPFLGLETCGLDESDLDTAIEEALTCFCIAAEKHGLGLESELQFLGWTQAEPLDENHSILSNNAGNESMVAALSTGDTRAIKVDERNLSPVFA